MSTSTIFLAGIPTWLDDKGQIKNLSLASSGYVQVQRSNTARRRKPSNVGTYSSATSVSTIINSRIDGAFSYVSGVGQVVHSSVGSVASLGGDIMLPSSEDLVKNKLRAKARGMSTNLQNMLAEYGQTAGLFEDVCSQVYHAARALRTRNPTTIKNYFLGHNVKRLGRKTAQQVLQFNYGVRPLISDINDSIAVLKKSAVRPMFQTTTVSHSESKEIRYSGYDIARKANRPDMYVDYVREVTSAKGWFEFKNDVLNNTLGQFGFTNPLATLYEICPWSYVVDWFFNVGEFLQSLDNSLYFENAHFQKTVRHDFKRTARIGDGVGYYKTESIIRSPVYSLGSVANLRFKPGFSPTHIMNGLALISQTLAAK